jgi:hypothetical protein
MAWWLWMILGIGLLLAEIATPGGFYLLFFGLAGLLVGFLSLIGLNAPAWLQWLLFTVFSLIAVGFLRKPLVRRFSATSQSSTADVLDTDGLIGDCAIALESIDAGGIGKVEMRGSLWQARNRGLQTLIPGQRCVVEDKEGLMLAVRPQ